MTADGATSAMICENCLVLVTQDPESRIWTHPPELAERFSRTVCDDPAPGRAPSESEIRRGLGRPPKEKTAIFGHIPELRQEPSTRLLVGIDGAYKLVTEQGSMSKPVSWGFLTTGGSYGLGVTQIPGRIIGGKRAWQGELRALYWVLERTPPDHPMTIYTDSDDTCLLIEDWRLGYRPMPPGYTLDRLSGRPSTLERLADLIEKAGDRVEVQWVRGHVGHPLNEGANGLARMGRAWALGKLTRDEVKASARQMALRALRLQADYGQDFVNH